VDPDERIFIENLAARNQVQLEIFSHLNTDELRFHYNEATLCVYSPVFEPFGLVPLESMACGTPVVGVREGGVVESILDRYTGRLVERDPRMFADTITELLLNPKKRNEYRENCVQYINSNWSWEKSAANLEEYMNLWIESLN
jgi:glycosyltransferase involved in cell wall biosynthesis